VWRVETFPVRLITNGIITRARGIKTEKRRDIVSTIRWRRDVMSRWRDKMRNWFVIRKVPIRKVYIALYVNIGFTITLKRTSHSSAFADACYGKNSHSRMLPVWVVHCIRRESPRLPALIARNNREQPLRSGKQITGGVAGETGRGRGRTFRAIRAFLYEAHGGFRCVAFDTSSSRDH